MPDIGATLRETRMRRKIDISEVESQTKIRAKYLRALENEEWDLLPGPTFVKTFLRTYAEYLDIDPKPVVEEYKARYERPRPDQLTPFAPHLGGRRDRGRRARGPRLGPGGVVVAGVLVLVALLGVIGWLAGGDDDEVPVAGSTAPVPAQTTKTTPAKPKREATRRRRPAAKTVRLQVVPTGAVWVCLLDARGRKLIGGRPVAPGEEGLGPFRSSRFRITLGNGNAVLRVNGKRLTVPETSAGIGYEIRRDGSRKTLPAGVRPDCT